MENGHTPKTISMSAAPNNTNALKPSSERIAYVVKIRGTHAERKAWRKAACGGKFNTWAREALNRAAK
jgi:hypothetical protein